MDSHNTNADGVAMRPDRILAARTQLEHLVAGQEQLPRRHRPVLLAIALTLVLAAGAGIAATTLIAHKPVTDASTIECRTSLNPDDPGQFAAGPVAQSPDVTAKAKILNALSACRQGWSIGLYKLGQPFHAPGPGWNPDAVPPQAVPSLTTCVAQDGHAVVIPSADPQNCLTLRLSILAAG